MRLIDADELLKTLIEINAPYREDINRAIIYAPTIAPVRHGEWIATDDPWFSACSVCGYLDYECVKSNYCPECGAKMDGGTDNETD